MELLDKFQKWSKKSKVFLNLQVCRPVVTGGYGLRLLSKHLRRVAPSEVTKTSDIDIHLNLRGTIYENDVDTFIKLIKSQLIYWIEDFAKFSKTDKRDYKFHSLKFNKETKTKVGNYYIHYLISVKYKGGQFLDFAVTNEPYIDYLKIPIVNRTVFKKYGLPIKTVRGYKDEMFHVFFLENIKELGNIAYIRRNPKNGIIKSKGKKDLMRIKYLCDMKKKVNPSLYSDRRCVAFKKYVKPYVGVFTTKKKIEEQAKKVYAVIK
tara:strand:+ start:2383 stop:3171 length:789 start_codon:yes stop_codon:yes gene_type:complete